MRRSPVSRLRNERQTRSLLDDHARSLRDVGEEHIVIDDVRYLIVRSANGHFWQIGVDDTGALTTTDMGTAL